MMDRWNAKTIAFVLGAMILSSILGLAVMKVNNAVQPRTDAKTAEQKLRGLESSSEIQSPAAKNFVQNEQTRREATKEAETAAAGE